MLRSIVCVALSLPLVGQGWVDRTPANPLASPSARFDPGMCWDAAHGYVLMFGGVSYYGSIYPDDTWTWNGSAWTQQAPATHPNSSLGNGIMGQVAGHSYALTFHTPTNQALLVSAGSTYVWTGSNWLAQSAASIPSANPSSGMPTNVALGRDETRNQTVLFVGSHVQPNAGQPILQQGSETLLWDGFGWTLRQTATHPFPAEQPSLTFDPGTGKLLLCTTDANDSQSWFWDWNGTNWVQRSVAPSPTAGGAVAGDPAHNKVVMLDASLAPAPGHTWTIDAGTGMQIAPSVEPGRRQCAGCTYDPIHHRTVVFGGINGPLSSSLFALADTWEFDLGAGAGWSSFGAGCAGSRGVPAISPQGTSLPRIGQTFELHVGNLPFTGPVFLFFGLSNTSYGPTPLPFALGGIGAPGCSVLCSGEELIVLTNVLGSAVWQRAIPNFPGLTFYNQAVAFDPAANALGLTASNGGQGVVGF